MKFGLPTIGFIIVMATIYEFGLLQREVAIKNQKIQKLQQELDWWKCERQPEQPQPPTLIESN